MAAEKFFVFYTKAYGAKPCREEFDGESELLEFIKKAHDDPSESYRDLVVIEGRRLKFEPHEVVMAWKIKDDDAE